MLWLLAIFALLIGTVIGYLLSDRKFRQQTLLLQTNQARLEEKLAASESTLLEKQKAFDQTESKLREAFASLSADALAKNNEAFLNLAREKFTTLSTEAAGSLDQRKAQIEGLLNPMKEILAQYQTRLGELEQSRTSAYADLKQLLGAVSITQQKLALETTQLVTALRRPQTRGQWGEIALRRLVELAGMTARCDFFEQTTVDTDQGKQQRPDMIVHLPGKRQIVIDCKAVLDAFLDAVGTTDEQLRQTHLARHARQIRSRASELSSKAYYNQFDQSPEFVMMFLPNEAFLYAAVEQDAALIEDCMKNNVILATPTTLISLLKAIEFGWRQEQVAENAEQIRNLATTLYDRLVKLANDFTKVGGSLEMTVKNYNEMIGSLESRVLVTARKIGELGARSDKELPAVEPIERTVRELSSALRSLPE